MPTFSCNGSEKPLTVTLRMYNGDVDIVIEGERVLSITSEGYLHKYPIHHSKLVEQLKLTPKAKIKVMGD